MNKPNTPPPTPEQIAICAYLIWEKEGRPDGRHAAHWTQAEKQLLAAFSYDNGMAHRRNSVRKGAVAK